MNVPLLLSNDILLWPEAEAASITLDQRARLRQAVRYRGLFARVAEQLGLGPNGRSHVRRVALGERRSRRVEIRLAQELQRMEAA